MADEVVVTAPAPVTVTTVPSGTIQGEPGPKVSAVDAATAAARAQVAAGKPIAPAEAPAPKTTPTTAATQPRNNDGTFIDTGKTPKKDPAVAGEIKPTDETVVADAEITDETEEEKTARETAERASETEEQKTARELEERTVTLTGRNNLEYEFVAPDKETADVMRQLRNDAMRGESLQASQADIARRSEEIEEFIESVELDKSGFLMESMKDDPETIEHVVLFFASHPEFEKTLLPKLMALADAKERRSTHNEQKARRAELRDEMSEVRQDRVVVRENLQDVQSTVAAMLPTAMSEAQQRVLYGDCLRDLKEYADRYRLKTIPVKDIPNLLANRLTAYGVNPVEAAARAAESANRKSQPGRRTAPRAVPTGTPAPKRVAAPPATAKQFEVSAQRKGAVAAIPPAGAGSPSGAPMTPPLKADGSKMNIEETIAWQRQQIKKGVKRM